MQWVMNEIWPKIHEHIPFATLNIFGAYPDRESMASRLAMNPTYLF